MFIVVEGATVGPIASQDGSISSSEVYVVFTRSSFSLFLTPFIHPLPSKMVSFLALTIFISSITAITFDLPAPTQIWQNFAAVSASEDANPIPTNPPSRAELARRQQLYQDVIMGPDQTCGFASGSSNSPFGLCCDTCSCGFKTKSGQNGDLYCCDGNSCETRTPTACVDGHAFSVLSSCDLKCQSDSATLVW